MAGRKRRWLFLRWAAATLLLLAGLALWAQENDNFFAVTPGEAYRSAQLEPEELRGYLQKYKIRSVLNLRGRQDDAPWYRQEILVCRDLGVRHYDVGLSAYRAPRPADTRLILTAFREAPRPVLIHCQGGADRTGLVAAMWKAAVDREPKAKARGQLSWRFGHLPWGRKLVLDRFFAKWSPAGM